jgi:hypothetical protein
VCTLSWTPGTAGYTLVFNRDERRTRAPARAPARHVVRGTTILAPVDGDFGGTWIGVNEHGVTAALLNRYEDAPADPGPGRVSRGLLLREVLAAPSAEALMARLAPGSLGAYLPFTIGAADPGGGLLLADWTGRTVERSATRHPGLVRTSSGRDQREAELIRGRVWHELAGPGAGVTPDLLDRLHRSHLPERGPFSVCMHRDEAATQSLTTVLVEHDLATLRYVPGPPCETTTAIVDHLPIRIAR